MQLIAHSTKSSKIPDPISTLNQGSGSSSSSSSSSSTPHKDAGLISAGEAPKVLKSKTSKHRCWQPVLVAYGSDSSGEETLSSGREVVRRGPAAMSLWAIEAHGKNIGVLSDPACFLQLRCSFYTDTIVIALLSAAGSDLHSTIVCV